DGERRRRLRARSPPEWMPSGTGFFSPAEGRSAPEPLLIKWSTRRTANRGAEFREFARRRPSSVRRGEIRLASSCPAPYNERPCASHPVAWPLTLEKTPTTGDAWPRTQELRAMSTPSEEQALLALFRQGDQDAARKIVERYLDRLLL